MSRRNFEPWEEIFIYLSNPLFSHAIIGEYLNRGKGSIQTYLYRKGFVKKGYFLDIKNGDRFGALTVLEKSFIRKRHRYYLCKCDCGNKVNIRSGSLSSGNSKTCGDCKNYIASRSLKIYRKPKRGSKKGIGYITHQWFDRFRINANKRGIPFKIDMEFVNDLFIKQNQKCVYTGLDLKILDTRMGMGSTASIDRIDSTKAYTEDNIQIVHIDINKMKQEFDEKYFLKMCNLITNNHKDK